MEYRKDTAEMAQIIPERIALTNTLVPNSVGSELDFALVSCDAEKGEYVLSCKTTDWMRNVMGSLHGGMSATVVDHAMGVVANSIRMENGVGPTVQLQLTYHRPLTAGKDVLVTVRVLSVSRTMTHLTAQAVQADAPETLCVSATGIYYFKPAR